jgi:hypothetical protein
MDIVVGSLIYVEVEAAEDIKTYDLKLSVPVALKAET